MDLRFGGGGFLGCLGFFGGGRGGVWVSRQRGGGFAGVLLRGLLGVGGLDPQLDSKISSSAHPCHANSPRLA